MSRPSLAPPLRTHHESNWFPVTIRVAWELMLAGVKVRPGVLSDVREHVLRCIPPGAGADEAERSAGTFVRDYLLRARESSYRRSVPDSDDALCIDGEWQTRLVSAMDGLGREIIRLHYGDGLPLSRIEAHLCVARSRLLSARQRVRETARALLLGDGLDVDDWTSERLDGLVRRIAVWTDALCPASHLLLTEAGQRHADDCPRCSRAVRLIRGGVLSPSDLVCPPMNEMVPPHEVTVLALLLHPDGRRHSRRLERALNQWGVAAGPDAFLVDGGDLEKVLPRLKDLCLESTPPRHHLRGARVSGAGRWRRGVLLGETPLQALERARSHPWGEIDGVGELPAPLPPPPRATLWWAGALLSLLVAVVTGAWVALPSDPPPVTPVVAEFKQLGSGWEVRFDTQDLAVVDIVVDEEGRLLVDTLALGVEKGQWATGDGAYKIRVGHPGVAIVTSPGGIGELGDLVAAAQADPHPLASLASRIQAVHPEAGVVVSPRIRSEPENGL